MTTFSDTISALMEETAGYSGTTRVWMAAMAMTYSLSLVFVWARPASRWILAAFLVNAIGIVTIKWLSPDLARSTIGTVIHLVFWPIALTMAWRTHKATVPETGDGAFQRVYLGWLVAACLIMAISIILDARTLLGWLA